MSISVLMLLYVYVRYNALYIKLFALYNNILLWRLVKTENRFKTSFQQPKTGLPVLTSLVWTALFFHNQPLNKGYARLTELSAIII